MKKIIPLNNDWYYKPSFSQQDVDAISEIDTFDSIRLPHTNCELPFHYFDEKLFQFESCYKKKLPPLETTSDEEVILHFEGVMVYARVFVNGHFAFEHKGGYTPFSSNIKPFLEPEDNWVTVHVDSTERPEIPPFGFVVDYLTYGGIYREVQLEIKHRQHFQHVKIETPTPDHKKFAAVISYTLTERLKSDQIVTATIKKGAHVIAQKRMALSSGDYADSVIKIDALTDIKPWNLDSPELYTLTLELSNLVESIDIFETAFGFRTVSFKPDGFALNGEQIKIRGLNRHQSFPYVGYAMPKNAQYQDADLLKYELGVNVVRSSHYPPSRHFLDRCDAIGLLVFEEIPGWQHIGDTAWQALAIQSVDEMIRRDWNHPSVILWGVRINESPDSDAFYEKTNALARNLDTTRPTAGVRNFAGSHILEDVYTYNDFVHRGNNHALDSAKKIAKKSMPYLVSEHNGHMFPTKTFDSEARRIEHALRHARVLNSAYGASDNSGAIGWCMADYNTHKDFGSGDKICYHGVLDMFRIPKYAAALYASQADVKPVMTVASNMLGGDFDASELGNVTVFTNCDTIKVYKNDRFIKQFSPTRKDFENLPHPPIFVDDLIGDLIKENERFSNKDAESIKKILLKFVEYGNDLPLKYKLQMGLLFLKYKMNFAEGASLYGKYIASWGEKSTTYKFEGYKNDLCVCTVEKNSSSGLKLSVTSDQSTLMETETYDVTRVVVKLEDENHQPLFYASAVAEIEIDGPLEIIGPKQFALIGGARAFWVKTTGQRGPATVHVSLESGLSSQITLQIQ